MTKKELQEKLKEKGIPFKVRDTAPELQALLDQFPDPEPISTNEMPLEVDEVITVDAEGASAEPEPIATEPNERGASLPPEEIKITGELDTENVEIEEVELNGDYNEDEYDDEEVVIENFKYVTPVFKDEDGWKFETLDQNRGKVQGFNFEEDQEEEAKEFHHFVINGR